MSESSAPSSGRVSPVTYVAVLVAVVLGGTTFYYWRQAREARQARPQGAATAQPEDATGPGAGDQGDSAALRLLQQENRALRLQLWERTVASEGPQRAPRGDGGVRQGWRDWLERLKKTDPERYRRMEERRQRRRARREESFLEGLTRIQQRLEALREAGDDPATRTEAERLSKMEQVMSELRELGDQWNALRELPDGERRDKAEELAERGRELYDALRTLQTQDRRSQVAQVGSQLGLDAQASQRLASEVDRIVDATSTRGFRPRGARGGSTRGTRDRK